MKIKTIFNYLMPILVIVILSIIFLIHNSSQNIKRKSLQMRLILNVKDENNLREILFALDYPDDTLSDKTINRIEKYLCKFLSTQKVNPQTIIAIRVIKESNETRLFDLEYGGTDATNFIERSNIYLFYAYENLKLKTKLIHINNLSKYQFIDTNSCIH